MMRLDLYLELIEAVRVQILSWTGAESITGFLGDNLYAEAGGKRFRPDGWVGPLELATLYPMAELLARIDDEVNKDKDVV